MRKIKLLLLSLSSVLLLNSCTILGIGAASYLTLLSFCFESGCVSYTDEIKTDDYKGIVNYFNKNKGKEEEYLEDLKQREKEKIQVNGDVYINVPKGFKFKVYYDSKEIKTGYLIDAKKGIGSMILMEVYKNGGENEKYSSKMVYEGKRNDEDVYTIFQDNGIHIICYRGIPKLKVLIKKITESVYVRGRLDSREKIDAITSYIVEGL